MNCVSLVAVHSAQIATLFYTDDFFFFPGKGDIAKLDFALRIEKHNGIIPVRNFLLIVQNLKYPLRPHKGRLNIAKHACDIVQGPAELFRVGQKADDRTDGHGSPYGEDSSCCDDEGELILHFKEYEGDYSKELQLVLSKIMLVDPHLHFAYMPIIATLIIHFHCWV